MLKKSQLVAIIGLAIILLSCGVIYFFALSNENELQAQHELEILKEIEMTNSKDSITNIGETDCTYNYISNPLELASINILSIGLQNLGDDVNNYLKNQGYSSRELTIENTIYDNSKITITLSISDCDDELTVIYDNVENYTNMYISD